MKSFLAILFILLLASCKGPEVKSDVLALKEMGDLATVEYTITKIIKANDKAPWYKVGERKILLSTEAVIKAGIDMESITKKNFTIDGKDIRVVLPEPKIISISMPADRIKLEYEEVTMLRHPFKSEERDDLLRQGEKQIRESIGSLGILEQARINTNLFVTNFLRRLGYEDVVVTFRDSEIPEQ